jgi:putative ATP-binding cassette transporter
MIKNLLLFYSRQVTGPWILILLMSLVAAVANGLILTIINETIKAQSEGTLSVYHLYSFIGCLVLYLIGGYFSMYKTTEAAGYMMHNLRLRLSRQFLQSSLLRVEGYDKGELFAHFTVDIAQLAQTALKLVRTFHSIIVLFFCFIYITWLAGFGALLLLAGIAFGLLAYFAQHKKARQSQIIARNGEAAFFATISDKLKGFKELKLNKKMTEDLLSHQEELSDTFRSNYTESELFFYKSNLISQICLFLVLAFVIFLPLGWIVSDSTTLFQLLAALLFAIKPIEDVVDSIAPITRGAVALEKIAALSKMLEDDVETSSLSVNLNTIPVDISLNDVRLEYKSDDHEECFHLGPVNLTIKQGDVVFIVGGNGSGKTTLLKLIAGLYVPDSGTLSVNKKPLAEEDIQSYRQLFSAIFSDFHLFKYIFGVENLCAEKAQHLLKRFGLDKKTELKSNRFSTTSLSTGQRKRLALNILMLIDRPFIIFDEFAADQDPAFRRFFYEELLPELKTSGKTVIAVTHDDMFFDCCDRLIKLDLGGIVSDEIHGSQSDRAKK